jgi:hypothetical protein
MFRAFLAHHQELLHYLVSRSLWQTVIQSIIYRLYIYIYIYIYMCVQVFVGYVMLVSRNWLFCCYIFVYVLWNRVVISIVSLCLMLPC